MKSLKTLVAVCALSLSACQAIPTETLNDRLAIGYQTVTVVTNTTAELVRSGIRPVEDGEAVLKMAEGSKSALDVAKNYLRLNLQSNAAKAMALAEDVLKQLKAYVGAK